MSRFDFRNCQLNLQSPLVFTLSADAGRFTTCVNQK